MYSTKNPAVTPLIQVSNTTERRYVSTPQRKARYNDKDRVRLKDIKAIALKKCCASSTYEIKQRLISLGIKLDLRLTAAWVAIASELSDSLLSCLITPGAKVIWDYPVGWGYYEQWFPLTVREVCGDMVYLDYKESPVSISTLTLAA